MKKSKKLYRYKVIIQFDSCACLEIFTTYIDDCTSKNQAIKKVMKKLELETEDILGVEAHEIKKMS